MRHLSTIKELSKRPGVNKILGGIAYLSSEKLVKLIIGLVVQSLIARYLGPEKFGLINYAVNTVLIFSLFISLGLDEYLIKELVASKDEYSKTELISAGIGLRSFAVLVSFTILFILASIDFFTASTIVKNYILFFSLILFIQPLITFEVMFFSESKNKVIFQTRFFGYLLGTIVKICALLLHLNPVYILISYMVEEIGGKTALVFAFKRHYKLVVENIFSRKTFALLPKVYPVILLTFVLAVDSRLGFQFVRLIKDESALGFYSVSFSLVDVWSLVALAITTSIFPKLIETRFILNDEYVRRVEYLFSFCLWVAIVLVIATHMVSNSLIKFLFGEKYNGAENYLRVMSYLLIPMFINSARTKYFILEDKALKWFLLNLTVTATSILLISQLNIVSISTIIMAIMTSHACVNLFFSVFDSDIRFTCILAVKSIFSPFIFMIRHFAASKKP